MVKARFRTHPGEVLELDFIRPRGLSTRKVAQDIGVPTRRLDAILQGRRPLTAETSLRLGRYFGISGRFWIRLQTDYDMKMESARLGSRLADEVVVLDQSR